MIGFFHFIPFYGRMVSHYTDMLQFVYPFISWVDGNLGCFHFLAVISDSARSIRVQVFVWTNMFSFLLGVYRGLELLGHTVTLGLTF